MDRLTAVSVHVPVSTCFYSCFQLEKDGSRSFVNIHTT
ncbi:hypothetical protein MASSI9I_70366 [Massilia sp. 9I]|nr:hypothetical protein MASSI9I_70366 [Massilia sp. 9I]